MTSPAARPASVYDQFQDVHCFADLTPEQQAIVKVKAIKHLKREIAHVEAGYPNRDTINLKEFFDLPGFDRQACIRAFSHKDYDWMVELQFWSRPSIISNPDSEHGHFTMSSGLWDVMLLDELDCYNFDRTGHWYHMALASIEQGKFSPHRTSIQRGQGHEKLVKKRIAHRREQVRSANEAARAASRSAERTVCPTCESAGHRPRTQHRSDGKWQYACGATWNDYDEAAIGTGDSPVPDPAVRGYHKDKFNAACAEIKRLRELAAGAASRSGAPALIADVQRELASHVDIEAELKYSPHEPKS